MEKIRKEKERGFQERLLLDREHRCYHRVYRPLSTFFHVDCKYPRLFSNCKTKRRWLLIPRWKVCIPSELVTWTILYSVAEDRCRKSRRLQTLNGAIENVFIKPQRRLESFFEFSNTNAWPRARKYLDGVHDFWNDFFSCYESNMMTPPFGKSFCKSPRERIIFKPLAFYVSLLCYLLIFAFDIELTFESEHFIGDLCFIHCR